FDQTDATGSKVEMASTSSRSVRIIGVPMDLGQSRRGVDMGPSAVRYAELQKRLSHRGLHVTDGGNIAVSVVEAIDDSPEAGLAHQASAIGAVCREIYRQALEIVEHDEIAIFLGGDHSISIGTVAAALHRADRVGVLWIDAHGDFNTPQTTLTGNVHGMVVAALMGMCPPVLTVGERRLRPEQIVMIGVRDLDPEERVALRASGIRVLTMRDIDEKGMAWVIGEALAALSDFDVLHVSFDMDSLDPQ